MGVGDQRHAPAALPPGKTRYPLYGRLGGSQDRSGQVSPPGFDPRTVQPVASRYIDWAIPAHLSHYILMKLFYFVAVLGDANFSFINQFLDTPVEGFDWVITVWWCIWMRLCFVVIVGDVIFSLNRGKYLCFHFLKVLYGNLYTLFIMVLNIKMGNGKLGWIENWNNWIKEKIQ